MKYYKIDETFKRDGHEYSEALRGRSAYWDNDWLEKGLS